ncbi:hypothetical protein [Aliiruegeria sabulilitoris]|uniref:hypothetical protein n=1 Tax=Aliiruegeria sabulilitoris TaxID=1510458 RepID=UPI0012E346E7|nr:hypothetical protein [Aliiruegeria sabulilitoris]NDR55424.1 hypothetical protein [Pseudoruegeria sp. M32A2M]
MSKRKPHAPEIKACPYMLRGLRVDRNNQVRAAEITCQPMRNGFLYSAAPRFGPRRNAPGQALLAEK